MSARGRTGVSCALSLALPVSAEGEVDESRERERGTPRRPDKWNGGRGGLRLIENKIKINK